MKKEGKPVETKFDKMHELLMQAKDATEKMPETIDFSDTKIAFESKSDDQLKKAAWLFRLMNKQWLVNLGASIGVAAIKLRLPFVDTIVRRTIFEQFVGGTTLLESQPTIEKLFDYKCQTILDYGAEAKDSEEDFNIIMNELIRAIDFAATNDSVPVVSSKLSGLARNALLEEVQIKGPENMLDNPEFKALQKRVDSICNAASLKGVAVFFDAEETWIQDTIDYLVNTMMERYNKEKVVVYNTYQLYRHDRLAYLMKSYEDSRAKNYLLGAKLVRGAYMEKERDRAADRGYPSPIQPNKEATDRDYNLAIRFCIEHYEEIALCNASHNAESSRVMAALIHEKGLQKDHPHLNFCQLYGMSDHLTFNLASAGYNVAKYVPYGPVREVIPYLIRRAQENTSVTGDMSRELNMIMQEVERRSLS